MDSQSHLWEICHLEIILPRDARTVVRLCCNSRAAPPAKLAAAKLACPKFSLASLVSRLHPLFCLLFTEYFSNNLCLLGLPSWRIYIWSLMQWEGDAFLISFPWKRRWHLCQAGPSTHKVTFALWNLVLRRREETTEAGLCGNGEHKEWPAHSQSGSESLKWGNKTSGLEEQLYLAPVKIKLSQNNHQPYSVMS